jgi:FkbM family methyltransferase
MVKTNKISNLKRLNSTNRVIVLSYLLKRVLQIKTSRNENNIYTYYNFLINSNGFFFEETSSDIISSFKNIYFKRIKLRKKPSSDFDVFTQVFGWLVYEPVIDSYNENFKNDIDYKLNIIDAGSNIGLTSLYFIDMFKNPNIICLEPEIENFKVLEYNLIKNNNSNVHKINGAIWSSNTHIKIVKDFRDKLNWSFRVEETDDSTQIKAFTINQLVEDYNLELIDILKIDIEGAEKQIFTSEKADLDFLKITRCLALEIHDEFNCRNDIYNILIYFGFVFFNKGELTIAINQNLVKR